MEDWETVSYVASSKVRRSILEKLLQPKIPSVLASELNISRSHISRGLRQLMSRELIVCKTPNVRRAKVYAITEKGKKVLEEAKRVSLPR